MFGLLGLVALGAVGYFSAAIARERGAPLRSWAPTAWRAAVGIALARLTILCGGWLLLRVDLIRPFRLFLLTLLAGNLVVEMGVATALYGARALDSSLLLAALITLTSIPLGFAWSLIRSQPRSSGAA